MVFALYCSLLDPYPPASLKVSGAELTKARRQDLIRLVYRDAIINRRDTVADVFQTTGIWPFRREGVMRAVAKTAGTTALLGDAVGLLEAHHAQDGAPQRTAGAGTGDTAEPVLSEAPTNHQPVSRLTAAVHSPAETEPNDELIAAAGLLRVAATDQAGSALIRREAPLPRTPPAPPPSTPRPSTPPPQTAPTLRQAQLARSRTAPPTNNTQSRVGRLARLEAALHRGRIASRQLDARRNVRIGAPQPLVRFANLTGTEAFLSGVCERRRSHASHIVEAVDLTNRALQAHDEAWESLTPVTRYVAAALVASNFMEKVKRLDSVEIV